MATPVRQCRSGYPDPINPRVSSPLAYMEQAMARMSAVNHVRASASIFQIRAAPPHIVSRRAWRMVDIPAYPQITSGFNPRYPQSSTGYIGFLDPVGASASSQKSRDR